VSLDRIDAGVAPAPITSDHQWSTIERQAKALAKSSLVPAPLRGKPDDVLLVGIRGLELGLPLTQSLAYLYPVNGRLLTAAQLQLALLRRQGHDVWFEESTEDRATIVGIRRGSTREHRATWTIQMARLAGLTGKDVWKNYPAAMLRARATTALVTMAFSDCLMGLDPVTPEEFGVEHYGDVDDAPDHDPGTGAADAVVPTQPAAPGPDPAGAARNERTAIAGAMSRVPEGTWRAAWAKAWRSAGLPASAHDLADDQLEPARCLIRQYIVLAGLDAIGLRSDDERHAFIDAATGGETASCRNLTAEDFAAVGAALRDEFAALEEAQRAEADDAEDAGRPYADEAPDDDGPVADEPHGDDYDPGF
jgi:hypothetical protein